MIAVEIDNIFLFKLPNDSQYINKSDKKLSTMSKREEKEFEDDKEIVCRICKNSITQSKERIMVNGYHKHTFFNPQGILFQIGCFRSANGLRFAGEPTEEFTWFKGYFWEIAVCSKCLVHIGWRFTSPSIHHFHGLVIDRLIEL